MDASASYVVVGVGESAAGTSALGWARDLCALRGWRLEIVSAWPDCGEPLVHEVPGHFCATRNRAVEALNRALRAAAIEIDAAGVTVHIENLGVVDALVEHSRDAALLVLGEASTGRSRRAGVAPVDEQCRLRVACPVVVVGATMAA